MSKVFGEAVQNIETKKWAFIMRHSDGSIILEPNYDFDTKQEAEAELIKLLQGLGKQAKDLS